VSGERPLRVHLVPRPPRRDRNAHKEDFGRVLCIAGSERMPGAAVLMARAALRSGCGLVTVASRGAALAGFPSALPEAMLYPLPELDPLPELEISDGTAARIRSTAKLDALFSMPWDAIGIGPGLGTSAESAALIERLGGWPGPQCMDADALNVIAAGAAIGHSDRRVWTPHPGEFERLTGERPRSDVDRYSAALRFVEEHGGVLVLKGRHTVVAERGRYFVNLTGNPGMSTAGSGDVLTGAITGLLAQGLTPFDAAVLGVHAHGLAGDLAARERGEIGTIASDIADQLSHALRRLEPRRRSSRS
jgi:hydroxyethylthiazole kinase-like uncharacterized protein yjeF